MAALREMGVTSDEGAEADAEREVSHRLMTFGSLDAAMLTRLDSHAASGGGEVLG